MSTKLTRSAARDIVDLYRDTCHDALKRPFALDWREMLDLMTPMAAAVARDAGYDGAAVRKLSAMVEVAVDDEAELYLDQWRDVFAMLDEAVEIIESSEAPARKTDPPAPDTGETDLPRDIRIGESGNALLVLKHLWSVGAKDYDSRTTTEDMEGALKSQLKPVVADLSKRGKVETKSGRGGGVWLKITPSS